MSELKIKFEKATEDNKTVEAEKEKFQEWEIEDAARTIMRAAEIRQDAELMKLVAPKLEKKVKAAVDKYFLSGYEFLLKILKVKKISSVVRKKLIYVISNLKS